MWRTQQDFVRSFASVLVLMVSLAVCFIVVGLNWPDEREGRLIVRANHIPPVVTGASENVEIIPVVFETGSIPGTQQRHP